MNRQRRLYITKGKIERYKEEKKEAIEKIKGNWEVYEQLEYLKNDKAVVITTFKTIKSHALFECEESKTLQKSPEKSRQKIIELFNALDDKLKQDKNFIMKILRIEPGLYYFIHKELKNDEDIVIIAFEMIKEESFTECVDNKTLQKFQEKNRQKIIELFNALDDKLKQDKNFIMKILRIEPSLYDFIPETRKNDVDILLKSDKLNKLPKELKQDKNFVINLLNEDIDDYNWLDIELINDDDVALKLIEKNMFNFNYLSKKKQSDRNFIIKAIKINSQIFKLLTETLKNDQEIVFIAIENDVSIFSYIGDRIKNNKEFILSTLKQIPKIYFEFDEKLKKDQEIQKIMVDYHPQIIINSDMIFDYDFMYFALEANENFGEYCLNSKSKIDPIIKYFIRKKMYEKLMIINLVYINLDIMKKASMTLRNNKQFMLKVLEKNGLAIQYVGHDLIYDKEIIKTAINQNLKAYIFLPKDLQDKIKLKSRQFPKVKKLSPR